MRIIIKIAAALLAAAFVLVGLCARTAMAANVVQVGNCNGSSGVATISDGVSAVSAGGLVLVCPGTYPEQVLITKPLTLRGIKDGRNDQAVIVPPAGPMSTTARVSNFPNPGRPIAVQVLVLNTFNVDISDLTIDGTNNQVLGGTDSACKVPANETPILAGIYYGKASGTIRHVATRNQILSSTVPCHLAFGIIAEGGGAIVEMTIQDSSVRNYETVGVIVDNHGMTATITGNSIFGNPGTSVEGIQMAFGATGTISGNSVVNGNPSLVDTGILCDACHGVKISDNTIGDADAAVYLFSDDFSPVPYQGDANEAGITSNRVLGAFGTVPPDAAIYVCGNDSSIEENQIDGTVGPAIFLDNSCTSTITSGNDNEVEENSVNEACVGVLVNPASSGNEVDSNKFFNVPQTTASGIVCPANPSGASIALSSKLTVRLRGAQ